jgi:hypothetical protein
MKVNSDQSRSTATLEDTDAPRQQQPEPAPGTTDYAAPLREDDAELEADDDSFTPRGTLLFLLVMLLGYALYWAYLWFIVVIERGAGGV